MKWSSRMAAPWRVWTRRPEDQNGSYRQASQPSTPLLPPWAETSLQVTLQLAFIVAVGSLRTLRRLHLAWLPRILQDVILELANRDGPDITWIAEDLAIGSQILPDEWLSIAASGIRAVVDCRAEGHDPVDVLESLGITFLHLPTPDAGNFHPEQVTEGIAWIEQQLADGRPTLVHCRAGRGRSVMIGAAVLTRRGLSPDEALALVRERRPIVTPTPGQIFRLREFAEQSAPPGD